MSWTENEKSRILYIEKTLVEIQEALNELPTKRQLNALLAVIQPQLTNQQSEIEQLQATDGQDDLNAHKSPLADDHINYHTDIRGDIRYYTKSQSDDKLDEGLVDLADQFNLTIEEIDDTLSGHTTDLSIHFLEGSISHLNILDIGSYTHPELDYFVDSKGEISGIAELGADGKVPHAQLPALAITDTFVVSGQAAMLALTDAEIGDVAIRTELSKSFILTDEDYSVSENWQELLTPPNEVTSVFGRVGNVAANSSDYPQYFMSDGSRSISGTIKAPRGTAALPIYSFTDDPDTGMWSDGPDSLTFSVSGIQQMSLNTSGGLTVNSQVGSPTAAPLTPTGTTVTIDWNLSNTAILNLGSASGNVTVTMTNARNGTSYVLLVIQGATPRSITFSPSVKTEGRGGIPQLTQVNGAEDIFYFLYVNDSFYCNAQFNWGV